MIDEYVQVSLFVLSHDTAGSLLIEDAGLAMYHHTQ